MAQSLRRMLTVLPEDPDFYPQCPRGGSQPPVNPVTGD